ncbi:hypothetical protein MMC24_006548 [Lignoscripta atroalba]|nr:hypothetical protein [Lignoscripta atroalba]
MRGSQNDSPASTRLGYVTRPVATHNQAVNGRSMANPTFPQRNLKGPLGAPRLAGSPTLRTPPAFRRDAPVHLDGSPKASCREEVDTPVKAFMNANITPRSGPRKARVDSAASTPNGTPNGTPRSSRPASIVQTNEQAVESGRGLVGLRLQDVGGSHLERSRSVISDGKSSSSFRTASSERWQYHQEHASPETSPMFFHASEAKLAVSKNQSSNLTLQGKASNFVYANGQDDEPIEPFTCHTDAQVEEPNSRFFQGHGAPESNSTVPKPFVKTTPSISPSHSPRQSSFKPISKVALPRPPSPLKDVQISRTASLTKASPRRHSRLVSTGGPQKIELSPSGVTFTSPSDLGRRASIGSSVARRAGHAKSASASSIESTPSRRSSLRIGDNRLFTTEQSSINVEAALLQKDQAQLPVNEVSPTSATPSPARTVANISKLDHLNELAANARRERKVLDLEISNSSLLAINQTLEREMRKQNAELRRFRRLSRAGRLSIAPPKRSFSSRLSCSKGMDFGSDISGMSDDDGGLESFENDDDYDDGSIRISSLSPTAQIEHDTRIRAEDEQRLQLDLSKHRELLIDSQKMNQSLKRCLDRTEDLIAEGKKALEYRVRITDIGPVGGRVLTPDETDGHTTHSNGLLSPVHERNTNPWECVEMSLDRSAEGENHDRDSGIDLLHSPDSGGGDAGAGVGEYLEGLGVSWGV